MKNQILRTYQRTSSTNNDISQKNNYPKGINAYPNTITTNTQKHIQELANISPQISQLKKVQNLVDNSPQVKRAKQFQLKADQLKKANKQPSSTNLSKPIQAKWIIRNGEKLEVKNDYRLNEGERFAAADGEFDSLDMPVNGNLTAPSNEGIISKGRRSLQNFIAGVTTEGMYVENSSKPKDAIIDRANEEGIIGAGRRKLAGIMNPRLARPIEEQSKKMAFEQKIHEEMSSRAKTGRERVEHSKVAGNVLKVAGIATEAIPGASRIVSAGKAITSATEASGYSQQEDARRRVGSYAVGDDAAIHRAKVEEMKARKEGAMLDTAGHATNATLGAGGGLISSGGKLIRDVDKRTDNAKKQYGKAVFESDALDEFMKERETTEKRRNNDEFHQI